LLQRISAMSMTSESANERVTLARDASIAGKRVFVATGRCDFPTRERKTKELIRLSALNVFEPEKNKSVRFSSRTCERSGPSANWQAAR
jgi:hypothetical protein